MTEQEWHSCSDPRPMLAFLEGKASDRKLRSFAVACKMAYERQPPNWPWKDDPPPLAELEAVAKAAEDFVDGKMSSSDDLVGPTPVRLLHIVNLAINYSAFTAAMRAVDKSDLIEPSDSLGLQIIYTGLLRDIFGNPFRPITIDPAWLTWKDNTVCRIAQRIYDERKFEDMPLLGDSLEESGCTNQEILEHCRGDGIHVKGCWVLDALIGKE